MTDDTYYTDEEAAKLLRLSPWTLRQWRCRGFGPKFMKVGRRVLYRRPDLLDFIESNIYKNTSQYPDGSHANPTTPSDNGQKDDR